ncbi:hypothetical protein BZA05DRAFT_272352 [Tricharina praecox]|uniref:uncharacterized protein n=1 Tax=Tricharina praecox TaxID=43433 RepID=UPI00221F1E7F|nr:uncharacterized protein BZA05DRAFT_272352 [Tricharina praecox]KAI5853909.1 hypothetical protein BZA05DRAFT_272352 [Tricharina praecox]
MMSIINSSQPPATSVTMQHLYPGVFRPLFFPAPAEFTQPLLDGFVDAHDELLEENSLFTHSTRSREIGVDVDGTIREFRRREAVAATAQGEEGGDGDRTSLAEVRKLRLRSRMHTQAAAPREQILRKSKERMAAFEREIKVQEEAALKAFKEGIRRVVEATPIAE